MNHDFIKISLLLLLALVLFTVNLGGYDLWPADEPRYGQVAWEMISTGEYILPHVNGQPYTEKPPLFFWLVAALSYPVGDVTPWTTRLPSVAAGIITLTFTFLMARRLFDSRTALWTCLILITMQRFWWNSRFGQIDMTLTACLTVGLYAFLRFQEKRELRWLPLFYLAATLGLYAKGPGVGVFPTLFILAWSWRQPDRRFHWMHMVLGMGTAVVLYALWAVPAHWMTAQETQAAAADTLTSNMFRQTVGRFLLGVSHANWPWYYLETLPADWLPWTFFLPWTLLWTWRHRRENDSVKFLLCWVVPVFIFFTIAIGKRAVYLLPLFPAFAMLFAASIRDLMEGNYVLWRKRTGLAYAAFLLLAGCAPFILPFTQYGELWTPWLLLVTAAVWAPALFLLLKIKSGDIPQLPGVVAVMFCLLAISSVFIVFPIVNIHKSAKDFCAPLRSLSEKGIDYDLYSVGFAREEYLFYSRHFFKELYTDIIPMEHGHEMNQYELIKFQDKISRTIEKAAAKADIADIRNITEEEVAAMHDTMEEAVSKIGYAPELIATFQEALKQESNLFFEAFGSNKPAYLYVQENDWRWLYAIHPDMRNAVVLHHDQVGSRDVLLVANAAGKGLLEAAK